MIDITSQIYELGFIYGYQGEVAHPDELNKAEGTMAEYNAGYEAGKSCFDKMLELMGLFEQSSREIHELAINRLYEEVNKSLKK